MKFKYAIKKIEKKNGHIVYIPMARQATKMPINIHEWMRIIKLYDTYELTTDYIDTDFNLSGQGCIDHINGFKKKQEELMGDKTELVEMINEDEILKIA